MRIIKKLDLMTLFILVLFSALFIGAEVNASDQKAENIGATYRVEKIVDQSDLGYGLTYSRSIAYSSAKSGHYTGKDGGTVGSPIAADREYQQQVNLLEMEKNSEVQLIPYAYLSNGLWNKLTIRDAALHFELENPGKKVIAGVNGDWFQIDLPQPASTGVTISNGEHYKNNTLHGAVNTLVLDNELESGKRIYQIADRAVKPMLAIYDENGNIIKEICIDKVNSEPANGEIALYYARKTSEFTYNTIEQKVTNAYIIDKAKKAVTTIDPNYTIDDFYGLGKITSFESSFDLGLGNFAIKTNNSSIDEYLKQGVTIRCQFEFQNEALSGVKNAIGFPYGVLKNGVPIYPEGEGYTSGYLSDAKTRKPRTFLGIREDGSVVFATVDGRQSSSNMHGMTLMEMAATMQYYGCVDAWKFDGGGSVTMIIRKQSNVKVSASYNELAANNWHVVNSPSDNSERLDGNCLLMVVDAPEITVDYTEITDKTATLKVALISDIEKYKEIYVYINNEFFKVENGQAHITGLTANTKYNYEIYAKMDGSMNSLLTIGNFSTNKEAPTYVNITVSLFTKGDVKQIRVKYNYDGKQAVKSIVLILDEERFVSAGGSLMINSDEFDFFFDNIKDGTVEVKYNVNALFKDENILFEDFKIVFELAYIMEEMKYETDNMFKDIFE